MLSQFKNAKQQWLGEQREETAPTCVITPDRFLEKFPKSLCHDYKGMKVSLKR